MDYDEARHGSNAYEMLQSGDFIVHTYEGQPDDWNLKPPLSYWLIALGYRLFGFNAVGLRAYSALSMLLTMVMISLWLKRRHGTAASLFSFALLLANASIFEWHFARYGDADALFVLFYSASMLCMLDSERDIRRLYVSAACFGLAFMAKGPHAALIPVSCFSHFCVTRGWKRLRLKHIPLLVFFGLLPALPWILARMARDGFHFFAQMLLVDVFARSTTVVEEHAGDWLYYIRYLLSFPGVVFAGALSLVGGILLLFSRRRLTNAQMGLILWLLIPILLFSAAVSKSFWYVFPILVPLAMAGGMAASAILRRTKLHGIMALCLALPLTFFITQNIRSIWETQSISGYGKAIVSILDRDFSSGLHIYVERQELPEWRQAERLYAQLAGDALCLDGGRAAFEQDEKRALLLVDREGSDHETLAEFYPLYYEDSNVLFYDNLGES